MKQPTAWIVALLVSVLVNGALVGFILHRTSDGPSWRVERGDGERRGAQPGGRFNVRAFVQALPADRQQAARDRLREEMREAAQLMRQAQVARLTAESALLAEPFDEQAAAAALDEMRRSRVAVEAHIEGVVLELVADLDAEARAQALQAGRQPGRRPPRDRRPPQRDY